MRPLHLGTRASQLAVTQSQWVADLVSAATGRPVELVRITTTGDTTEGSLAALGGTGVFATALRESLLAGECDFIVHSLKDLPTASFAGLTIAAIPRRERANDTLCSRDGTSLRELPAGARVGTGSPRRAAQVRHARPDLAVLDIRGNVDSRLAKVERGEYDAVILASAGLRRLGRFGEAAEEFALEDWPTSAGQGALAVECREDDTDVREMLATLSNADSLLTSELEREVLRQLEAGCSAPVGISAYIDRTAVHLVTEVYGALAGETLRVHRKYERGSISETTARVDAAKGVVADLVDRGLADLPGIGPSRE
jgi:hydroxymethylbilane synthase